MEKIAVIGAGLMGQGIAQVFAFSGHQVHVYDVKREALETLHSRTEKNLRDLGQDELAAQRITAFSDLSEAVDGVDVVFEAGPEDLVWKQEIFASLEAFAPKQALLASNTSAIPITRITERLSTGPRALGTHWWNPPYLLPLVEIIKTPATSEESAQQMFSLLLRVGKTPALVEKDIAGFIGNRLQHALWREAISLVANGVCDARTVDTVVKASFGRRMPVLGPLENADLVGTDLTLAIHQTLLPEIDKYPGPSPYLESLVRAGKLGMKTGEGFMHWTNDEREALRDRVLQHLKTMIMTDAAGRGNNGKKG